MAGLEKSIPPIIVSRPHAPPCAPSDHALSHQHTPSDNSPTSTKLRSDSDDDDRALTATTTRASRQSAFRTVTRFTTSGTTFTSDPAYEVDFEPDSRENPRDWSVWYKSWCIFTVAFGTLVVVMYSTSYTSAVPDMQREFGTSETVTTLGITSYLLGLAVGALLLAPLAETYGRKPVYTICMALFTLLALPAALAHDIQTVIVTRFFAAIFGSAMIANAPGSIADMVSDEYRSTAFSIWSIGPMNGPVIGPLIGSSVAQYLGWRWTTWIVMIWAGTAFVLLATIKETYSPALLQQKAKRLRRETGDERYWSQYDVRVGFVELMRINLSRPFIMAATEPICMFWNAYISLVYGILYLCFVSYPIVFSMRGWSLSMIGFSYVGIGLGTMVCICCATPIRKMINAHPRDEEGKLPPESMMSIVCIAAVLIPIGELWFAWTCYPTSIHWLASIAAGIPFGFGNGAVFIYASSYLAHSYGIYAASAMAGNAVMRSALGGTLPLAGQAMYRAMGPNWAGTLLGLLEVVIIPIPFLFYRYGGRIRAKSVMIREMRENEERQERKRKKAEERLHAAMLGGDAAEAQEARADLYRVRSRLNEDADPEGRGHETLNTLQGYGKETC